LRRCGPKLRAVFSAAVIVGAAGLLVWKIHSSTDFFARSFATFDAWGYAEEGESLLHGISPGWNPIRMPFSSVLAALFFRHWGFSPADWRILAVCLQCVLIFALSGMLLPAGVLPASLALGALLLSGGGGLWACYTESGFSILLLIVAGLLAWRAHAPAYRKSFLLSLAVGTSLLFRSPLVFFPPLLAIFEGRLRRSPEVKSYWKHALILCVVPYLFLIPWMRMNWALHHRFVPLENDAANVNIAAGALGFVTSMDGDWRQIVDPVNPNGVETIWGWAAREIGRHPFRYLKACAGRVAYALALHPGLFLAAFLALWLYRQKREFQVLGLLILYYMGLYCSMAVVSRYFDPLLPILAVLAAGGPFALLRTNAVVSRQRSLSGAGLVAFLAVALGCALYAEAKVVLYTSRIAQAHDLAGKYLDDAVSSRPQDAWLLFERGKRRLEGGRIAEAISDLSRSAASDPSDLECGLRLAWARMLQGDCASLLEWPILPDGRNNNLNVDAHLFKAHAYLRMGRAAAARQELQAALESELLMTSLVETGSAREQGVIDQLRSSPTGFISKASRLLEHRPVKERLLMLDELSKLWPQDENCRLKRANLLLEIGQRRKALEILKKAKGVAQVEGLRASALSYQLAGDCAGALRLWNTIVRGPYRRAKDFSDKAVCEYRQGDEAGAISDLRRAIAESPEALEAYASLGFVYSRRGLRREALEVYGRALALKPLPGTEALRRDVRDAKERLRDQMR